MSITVGTAVGIPGQRTRGELHLGYYPDGPITSPVTIVCGSQPGPTLWVQGCVHGAEIGGTIGALKFLQTLDPQRVRGTIVLLSHANPLAFRAQTRATPIDGENLNRMFPGSMEATHTRQLASLILETALDVADAILDLHSGGETGIVPFYALYWDDGSTASRESARLACSVGTMDLWATQDGWLSGSLFAQAVKANVPAVIVECGGGGLLPDEHIAAFSHAIAGVCQALQIIEGRPPLQAKYRTVDACSFLFCRRGGFVVPVAQAGSIVNEGELVAQLINPFGDVVEELYSPLGPAYIAATRRPYQPVYSGTMIAECVRVILE